MVELVVRDWRRSVEWYTALLGWPVTHTDEARGFALLEGAGGRLAFKQGEPLANSVRLEFQVDRIADEVRRLAELGIALCTPPKTSDEGYARLSLLDPDGYCVGLFDWSARQ
jgi:predicted enzyme related to lactoylglutathione lyase